MDFSKLGSALPDFRCEWTAERGADELARAYEAIGLTEDELTGRRFIRLGRIKFLRDEGDLPAARAVTAARASVTG